MKGEEGTRERERKKERPIGMREREEGAILRYRGELAISEGSLVRETKPTEIRTTKTRLKLVWIYEISINKSIL